MSNREFRPLLGAFAIFVSTLLILGGTHFHVHDANLNLATMTYDEVSSVKEVELTEISAKTGSGVSGSGSGASGSGSGVSGSGSGVSTASSSSRGAVTASADTSSYILIGGKKIETFSANEQMEQTNSSQLPETYSKVGYYNLNGDNNGIFYYGHNASNVFGVLDRLPVGTVFTVVTNGQKQNYKIAYKKVLEKAGLLDQSSRESTRRLKAIYNAGYHEDCDFSVVNGDVKCGEKHHYAIALMTCAGTNYGNGDASHRLIVEAVRV